MSVRVRSIVAGLGLVLGSLAADPAAAVVGKTSGYLFGDYYYALSGPKDKQNGFQFRRIYYTYDLKWNDQFSGRFRLEANDAGFGKTDKMNAYVKHAFLKYKMGDHSLSAGLVGTPTWAVSEEAWGYRSIEKTIIDLRKVGVATDAGALLEGALDAGGRIRVQVMVANGTGVTPEVDNDKKLYAQVQLKPAGDLVATVNADWQTQPGGKDQTTLAAFAGMNGKELHGGVEAFLRTNAKAAADGKDVKVKGVSIFGAAKLGEKLSAFGRADLYDPNGDVDKDGETLLIGGVDYQPTDGVHVMPNVLVTAYQDSGKDTEIMPRLTGYFKF